MNPDIAGYLFAGGGVEGFDKLFLCRFLFDLRPRKGSLKHSRGTNEAIGGASLTSIVPSAFV